MRDHPQMPAAEVERLLFHMAAIANGSEKGFERDFAKSIAKQSRKRGWWPSPKQLPVMRSLVSDLFASRDVNSKEDFSVIE